MMKERVVEGEQDDYLAARQADFEQQFQALPAAGTAAYWQRVETFGAGALLLEVLSRCLRERLRAGARRDAERIFDVIIPHVRKTIQFWIKIFDSQTPGGINQEVAKDLASECYLALWRELANAPDTFLLKGFRKKLKWIIHHVAHTFLEQEGVWQRKGVKDPTRVPITEQDSIDVSRDEESTTGLLSLTDSHSQPFGEEEVRIDIEEFLAQLDPKSRQMFYRYFYAGYTQQEIANLLHITDKTVREHLKRIVDELRTYLGGEEESRG
ncbi:MAG TPA: sigma-70 family RNA polymerase sigma factor [Ktedonobacterales bacterium]|jgi:RNA polymerase sigma factor (sigma-70 family)